MSSIQLYDIDRKGRRACWSPNTWKTRYVLNFKNLDYQTHWLEFPDIAPTLEAKNFPKSTEPNCTYTCPALLLPNPTSPSSPPTPIMESLTIAQTLEQSHPSPPLHLSAPELPLALDLIAQLRKPLAPVAMPLLVTEVLNPRSAEYKERELSGFLGMSVAEFGRVGGGEGVWERAGGALGELAALLKGRGGPFVLGETVSFTDFVIAAFLQAGKRFGDGVMYERIAAFDDVFEKLMVATEKWAERDDH